MEEVPNREVVLVEVPSQGEVIKAIQIGIMEVAALVEVPSLEDNPIHIQAMEDTTNLDATRRTASLIGIAQIQVTMSWVTRERQV